MSIRSDIRTHHLEENVFLLENFLDLPQQEELAGVISSMGDLENGFYRPVCRYGPMSIEMMCFGMHWNPQTYQYETHRSDHDNLPAHPLLPLFHRWAKDACRWIGDDIVPGVCIANRYGPKSKMGLHRDKDESPETIKNGIPVVSISLGNSCIFQLGGLKRKDPKRDLTLQSGDVLLWGGSDRLRYHGVKKILPQTSPLVTLPDHRINLTIRQL